MTKLTRKDLSEHIAKIEELVESELDVKFRVSSRLESLGRYSFNVDVNTGEVTPREIIIADWLHPDDVYPTIAHECAHYYAIREDATAGTGNSERDHKHPLFIYYCEALGTSPEPFVKSKSKKPKSKNHNRYECLCEGCGKNLGYYSSKGAQAVKSGGAGWQSTCCKTGLIVKDTHTGEILPRVPRKA